MRPDFVVLPDPDAVAAELAARTEAALRDALGSRGQASLCLTGGSTPKPAYRRLASADLDWSRISVWWTDERMVPPDDSDSNYRMARGALLDHVEIPENSVYRIEGELDAAEAARRMDAALTEAFGADGPTFDVLHMGMGGDAHTASLFPGSPALDVSDRLAAATHAPPSSPVHERVTLTYPLLNRARQTLMAATGEGKRDALALVLAAYRGDAEDAPPSARVAPAGPMTWLVDRALADGLVEQS